MNAPQLQKSFPDESSWFDSSKRMIDPLTGMVVVKLFSGDCYVAKQPGEMLVTILGSCIATCIRDPLAGIGGMNHFLLPGDGEDSSGTATRYGAYAMEQLINEIIKAGGSKNRLEVKVFGGGNVIKNSAQIGSRNAAFVKEFLAKESLQIVSADLEGIYPRRVHYYPDTGTVRMRKLQARADIGVIKHETAYRSQMVETPVEGDIDLF